MSPSLRRRLGLAVTRSGRLVLRDFRAVQAFAKYVASRKPLAVTYVTVAPGPYTRNGDTNTWWVLWHAVTQTLMYSWTWRGGLTHKQQQHMGFLKATLERHEAGHVKVAKDYAATLKPEDTGTNDLTKWNPDPMVKQLDAGLNDEEAAYDRRTDHGGEQRVRWPLSWCTS